MLAWLEVEWLMSSASKYRPEFCQSQSQHMRAAAPGQSSALSKKSVLSGPRSLSRRALDTHLHSDTRHRYQHSHLTMAGDKVPYVLSLLLPLLRTPL